MSHVVYSNSFSDVQDARSGKFSIRQRGARVASKGIIAHVVSVAPVKFTSDTENAAPESSNSASDSAGSVYVKVFPEGMSADIFSKGISACTCAEIGIPRQRLC